MGIVKETEYTEMPALVLQEYFNVPDPILRSVLKEMEKKYHYSPQIKINPSTGKRELYYKITPEIEEIIDELVDSYYRLNDGPKANIVDWHSAWRQLGQQYRINIISDIADLIENVDSELESSVSISQQYIDLLDSTVGLRNDTHVISDSKEFIFSLCALKMAEELTEDLFQETGNKIPEFEYIKKICSLAIIFPDNVSFYENHYDTYYRFSRPDLIIFTKKMNKCINDILLSYDKGYH